MSTRSYIFTETDKGYQGIYVHFDGYFEGVGTTLQASYTDQQAVNQLIKLGDLSSLGKQLAPCEAVKRYGFGAMFNQEYLALAPEEQARLREDYFSGQYTIAYHRDRDEELNITEYPNALALMNDLKQGYEMIANIYLFQNGKWFYFNRNSSKWCALEPRLKQITKQNEQEEIA
ncbi:hypothetical protein [Latilactobacillus fragifolii]|uniref:hypothetical protein n=1 Tax=Latilactobacillus fragifolii TaxID=2814244 RepID=UPI001ABB3FD6|nr:hypothetical protein [Latilactobacillus fragifolii]